MNGQDLEQLRWATAYHESGHAAFAVYFEDLTGWPLQEIEVSMNEKYLGVTRRQFDNMYELLGRMGRGDEVLFRAEIMLHLAGKVAENRAGYDSPAVYSSQDNTEIEVVFSLSRPIVPAAERDALLQALCLETEAILFPQARWAGVERLAGTLYRESFVSGERASGLLGACWKRCVQ